MRSMTPPLMSSMKPMPGPAGRGHGEHHDHAGREEVDVGAAVEAGDLGDRLEQRAEQQQPDDRLDQRDAQVGRLAGEHAQVAQVHLPGLADARSCRLRLRARLGVVERAAGVAQVDVVERRPGEGHRGGRARRAPRARRARRGSPRAPSRRAGAQRAAVERGRRRGRRRASSASARAGVVGRRRARPGWRRPASSLLSSSGVPSATIRPRSTIASCEASRSASSR